MFTHLFSRLLALVALATSLTQCVGPQPYDVPREHYRSQMREQDQQQTRQAYEAGQRDGQADLQAGFNRNPRPIAGSSLAEINAYRDGYDQGYRPPQAFQAPLPPSTNNAPGYPSAPGVPTYPSAPGYPGAAHPSAPSVANDPVYSQGYDCGLRDRVAGRQPDAGAYTGKYDPRYRRNFERGYFDAYESRR